MMIRRLPVVRRNDPFVLSSGLSELVNRFFTNFDDSLRDVGANVGRTDVYEKDGNLVFATELPGMQKNDIEIKVENGSLRISGETKKDEDVKEENYFRVGRRYGHFDRCYPLPDEQVEVKNIKARFEDGILRITAPLKESIKEKEAPVEIAVE